MQMAFKVSNSKDAEPQKVTTLITCPTLHVTNPAYIVRSVCLDITRDVDEPESWRVTPVFYIRNSCLFP
jgi:hypothetical protein